MKVLMLFVLLGLTSVGAVENGTKNICESSGFYLVKLPDTNAKKNEETVIGEPIIAIKDFVSVGYGVTNGLVVTVNLTDEAGRRLREFTDNHVGQRLGIVINDKILFSAMILGSLEKNFSMPIKDDEKAKKLHARMNALIKHCNIN